MRPARTHLKYAVHMFGSFSPQLFSLHWFERNKLVSKEDLESTPTPQIITAQMTLLTLGRWLAFRANAEELSLSTDTEIRIPDFRDFSISLLAPLSEAIIQQVELEIHTDWTFGSRQEANEFFQRFVPSRSFAGTNYGPKFVRLCTRAVQRDAEPHVHLDIRPKSSNGETLIIEQTLLLDMKLEQADERESVAHSAQGLLSDSFETFPKLAKSILIDIGLDV